MKKNQLKVGFEPMIIRSLGICSTHVQQPLPGWWICKYFAVTTKNLLGSTVTEWSKALLVRENNQKPKDPRFAPQLGQSLKKYSHLFILTSSHYNPLLHVQNRKQPFKSPKALFKKLWLILNKRNGLIRKNSLRQKSFNFSKAGVDGDGQSVRSRRQNGDEAPELHSVSTRWKVRMEWMFLVPSFWG